MIDFSCPATRKKEIQKAVLLLCSSWVNMKTMKNLCVKLKLGHITCVWVSCFDYLLYSDVPNDIIIRIIVIICDKLLTCFYHADSRQHRRANSKVNNDSFCGENADLSLSCGQPSPHSAFTQDSNLQYFFSSGSLNLSSTAQRVRPPLNKQWQYRFSFLKKRPNAAVSRV